MNIQQSTNRRRIDSKLRHLQSQRAGFMLIEAVIAAALLGVLAIVAIPLLGWGLKQQALATQQFYAAQELASAQERVLALSHWDEIEETRLAEIELTGRAIKQLRDAELTWSVESSDDQPRSKRVTARLVWRSDENVVTRPVSLTAWYFAPAEQTAGEPESGEGPEDEQ